MNEDKSDEEFISRSQKKRDAEAAQALGERLLELSNKQLQSLNLPESLVDAVQEAKSIKAHGGHKRQLQFIGKLMREMDADPLVSYFEQLDNKNYQQNAKFKQMENWRDQLVNGGNQVVEEFQAEFPSVDSQKLRQLIRNANNVKNEKLATKSKRAIFQYVKEIIADQ